jgi:hypothetical protein
MIPAVWLQCAGRFTKTLDEGLILITETFFAGAHLIRYGDDFGNQSQGKYDVGCETHFDRRR